MCPQCLGRPSGIGRTAGARIVFGRVFCELVLGATWSLEQTTRRTAVRDVGFPVISVTLTVVCRREGFDLSRYCGRGRDQSLGSYFLDSDPPMRKPNNRMKPLWHPDKGLVEFFHLYRYFVQYV